MSRSRLQSLILQGFGQGRGEYYIPWIRVTRGNAPRKSNHFVAVVSTQSKALHLLSQLEHGAARVASWLGVCEIRTQFPLFPWAEHPHPLAGLNEACDAKLPKTRGLLELAAQAGISHGNYVGAPDLPYVATVDLALSVGSDGAQRLVLWSVKPAGLLTNSPSGSRMRQRIRLEALYAESIGAHHVVYDGSRVNDRLLANLDWLEPPRHERTDPEQVAARARFVSAFLPIDADAALGERIGRAAEASGLSTADGQRHFRAAAWLSELDIDLTLPVLMSRPMTTGGLAKQKALRNELLGDEQ